MPRRTILLNWVYYQPVGHAVEAFKVAKGLRKANQDAEVHVLLNSRTPVELARACDWIAEAYAIDLDQTARDGAQASCLGRIPRSWDDIVNDHRVTRSPFTFAPPLRTFHDIAATYFEARRWRGGHHDLHLPGAPGYERNATIRMAPPEAARAFARSLDLGPVNLCILPAGSMPEPIYPRIDWWRAAMTALLEAFPDAHIFLTGKSGDDGKSSTLGFPASGVEELARLSPRVFNCYDIGLWNQLALVERCDMLIAPHTGFAFLAPSVGTPWLAVSGVRWPECFFNEVPFYCVLPRCRQYPCWVDEMKPECVLRMSAGETVACMAEDLDARIPDLLEGARLLLTDDFTYDRAEARYGRRIEELGLAQQRFFRIE